ncbi:MAG: Uma2 family endonuclease [Paucibacter sp.]|nr:Uma2 family endonuclease [Roseateles sp.]MBV8380377.1 Uma2 family endonuclease [Roseateles sp.]
MGLPAVQSKMTAAEYLAWEAEQPERHDFVGGEVYAMSGAEARHVMVAGNLYMALRQHLKGSPCRTFMSDMKLAAADDSAYFYPDVFVTCSTVDRADPLIMHEPTLLAEVLSPATAAYDRGQKFAHYRDISSLHEVVFVDVDTRRVDVFRRNSEALWVLHPFGPGETVRLASVELDISADALFDDVDDPA